MNDPAAPSAAPRRARSVLDTVICGVLIFAAIVINQSAVHWRDDLGDDHLFAYYGWRIAHGARPYLDIWDNKPPGIFWVNAIAMSIDAPGPMGVILICSAALLIALIAFADVARSLFGRAYLIPATVIGCALLTQLRYECGGDRTETFVIAGELLVVSAYLRWLRSGRGFWLFLAAFGAGGAPLFKQAGVAAAAACMIHLLWLRFAVRPCAVPRVSRGAAVMAVIALLAPASVALAMLSAPGQLAAAWHAIVVFNRAYFAVGDATLFHLGPALAVYAPALAALAAPVALAAVGVALRIVNIVALRLQPKESVGASSKEIPAAGVLMLTWLALAFYLALISPGRREYHLMPVLPPLAVLALWPLAQLLASEAPAQRLLARPSLILVALVWLVLAVAPMTDTLSLAQRDWAKKTSWWGQQRREPTDDERRAARIRERTTPTDRIYIFGWSPGTYRYALRPCASRFATTEKAGQVGVHGDFILRGVAENLPLHPPAIIFISESGRAAMHAGVLADLATWIDTNYRAEESIGGMQLLRRRFLAAE